MAEFFRAKHLKSLANTLLKSAQTNDNHRAEKAGLYSGLL
jgi:hypothetical protein